MDIADKIIQSQNKLCVHKQDLFKYSLPEYDEFGLKTSNCIEYMVARIMYIQSKKTSGRLHFRDTDDRVWEGNQWVSEDVKNLYRLAKWNNTITQYQSVLIWEKLKEYLPKLSNDKIVISDNLVWDKITNELEFYEERPPVV